MNYVRQNFKRFLSIVLAVAISLSLLPPLTVTAAVEDNVPANSPIHHGYLKSLTFTNTQNKVFSDIVFDSTQAEQNLAITNSTNNMKLVLEAEENSYFTITTEDKTTNFSQFKDKPCTTTNLLLTTVLMKCPIGKTTTLKLYVGPENEVKSLQDENCDVYTLYITRRPALSALSISGEENEVVQLDSAFNIMNVFTAYTGISTAGKIKLTAKFASGIKCFIGNSSEPYTNSLESVEFELSDFSNDDDHADIPIRLVYDVEGEVRSENTYQLQIAKKDYRPIITIQPQDIICNKDEVKTLFVEANTISDGTLSYQWYQGIQGGGIPVEGEIINTFTPPTSVAKDTDYYCRITNTVNGKAFTAMSDNATVHVNLSHLTQPTILKHPGEYILTSKQDEDRSYDKTTYNMGEKFDQLYVRLVPPEKGVVFNYQFFYNTEETTVGAKPLEGFAASARETPDRIDVGFIPNSGLPAGEYYIYCVVTATSDGLEAVSSTSNFIKLTYNSLDLEGFSGSGTEEFPYEIQCPDDFVRIQNLVKSGIRLSGVYFKMKNDITLPEDWEPIGAYNVASGEQGISSFCGILDGGGNTLTVPEGGKPLFRYVGDAIIKNLNIFGTKIDGCGLIDDLYVDYGEDGDYWTGCPVSVTLDNVRLLTKSSTKGSGFMKGSGSGLNTITIRNCTIDPGVVIGYDKQETGIGSFVGGSFNGQIDNCTSAATVYGVDYVGGLVGGKGQTMGLCVIRNSSFLGKIEAKGEWIGGIIGRGYYDPQGSAPNTPPVSFINCYAAADITGANYIGGIFGGEPSLLAAVNDGDLRDSIFFGTITATGENPCVGGIVGYYGGINRHIGCTNNYFYEKSGTATSVIGDVQYYLQGSDPSSFADQAEIDAWKAQIGSIKKATDFSNGDVLRLLNEHGTYKNWIQGPSYPMFSGGPVLTGLELSGEYKTSYNINVDELDVTGMVVKAVWSDGRREDVPLSDVQFTGYDNTKRGIQTLTAVYGAAKAEFKVTVYVPEKTIYVKFFLMGDTKHGPLADEAEMHALAKGNLDTWIDCPKDYYYEMSSNDTVLNLIQKAIQQANEAAGKSIYELENPTGNYITHITRDGQRLGEKDNGADSGWMFTFNGEHLKLGVSEQFLEDNCEIIFHYTDDYNVEGTFIPGGDDDDPGFTTSNYKPYLDSVLKYLEREVNSPVVGSSRGEWAVLAQARYGSLSDGAKANYLEALKEYADEPDCNGRLDKTETQISHTEYSRVILALTSLGMDASKFVSNNATYNFVEYLFDKDNAQVSAQGNNGTLWALIALDSAKYYDNADGNKARATWIDELIKQQKKESDYGWSISNTSSAAQSDIDTTAMVLQALAPYYLNQVEYEKLGAKTSYEVLQLRVQRALNYLKNKQNPSTGGFDSAEADAQVIIALSALGEDASKYTKDTSRSVLSDLLSYCENENANGNVPCGFAHERGKTVNQMATEQAAYALVAYDRYKSGRNTLYDMTDVFTAGPTEPDKPSYIIKASSNGGGTITPYGDVTVEEGKNQEFKIKANPGYEIDSIKVDGALITNPETAKIATPVAANQILLTQESNAASPLDTAANCAVGNHGASITLGRKAATCTEYGYTGDQLCKDCGALIQSGTVIAKSGHEYGDAWHSDESGHWLVCQVCGVRGSVTAHTVNTVEPDPVNTPEPIPEESNTPGGGANANQQDAQESDPPEESDQNQLGDNEDNSIHSENFETEPSYSVANGNEHAVCEVCGYIIGSGTQEVPVCSNGHSGETATCTAQAVCALCGQRYGDLAVHQFTRWAHSDGIHWSSCEACGYEALYSVEKHDWVLDEVNSNDAVNVFTCRCGAEKREMISAPMAIADEAPQTPVWTEHSYTFSNVTQDHTIEVTFKHNSSVIEQEVSVSGNVQTAVITDDAVKSAIAAVSADAQNNTITIIPTATSGSVATVAVEMEKSSAQSIVDAGADVQINTSKGNVTIPNAVLKEIVTAATSSDIRFEVTPSSVSSVRDVVQNIIGRIPGADSTAVDVTIKSWNTEIRSGFTSTITIEIPVGNTFKAGTTYDVAIIHGDGTTGKIKGECFTESGKNYVRVTVNKLSTFVVFAASSTTPTNPTDPTPTTPAASYTITATYGSGGSIYPSNYSYTVQSGGTQGFTFLPDNGYEVEDVKVDGISIGARTSYTFSNVTANHSIRVTFKRTSSIPTFGTKIGTVRITIRNNTYSGGLTGTLVSGSFDLCSNDTMMTSILKALALNGYTWEGTGGTSRDGYDITYISSISKNGRTLGEFSGGPDSGWMGTLNGWFTSMGFGAFPVGGSGFYKLQSGDEIDVVYTVSGGPDVGGGSSSITTLSSLYVSGGTLSPSFSSSTTDYTLTISGTSAYVSVTPTAANKTYMARTYLNNYNQESYYYKNGQSFSVKAGDVIYVGCGESGWPGMNNNSIGTKYTIRVVNNNSADAVNQMIRALNTVTYANYKTQAGSITQARSAYNALNVTARASVSADLVRKLEQAEAKVSSYTLIDQVKSSLTALPAVNNAAAPSSSVVTQMRNVSSAYNSLTAEQKTYITVSDAARYGELREWLVEKGAVGANELAVIFGSSKLPESNTAIPFLDVNASDWFYDDVVYAYNKGLFNGDSPAGFAPYGNMNRAMLVTVLHRFEGTPAVSQTSGFTDVASGQWFTNGVAWASSIGVVNGKGNGKFDPYGNITREEIATILYRYAKIKGWDVTASANLYSFNDGARTSDWATRAMQWAYAKGIINGKGGGTLDPSGYATRAEVAAMMRRFIEAY